MGYQRFLLFFPVILLSVAIHEFAHCWITDRLGDDTPRRQGRVTLNPLKHLDPVGTIMMVVSSLMGMGFGWGKASPFNPNNFQNPARDRMWTALAGPVSNLIQMLAWASLASLLLSFDPSHTYTGPVLLCSVGVLVNASLALFNLLPVYPLDGHHILSYLAPRSWRTWIDNPAWGYLFLAIVMLPQLNALVLGRFLWPIVEHVAGLAFLLAGVGR